MKQSVFLTKTEKTLPFNRYEGSAFLDLYQTCPDLRFRPQYVQTSGGKTTVFHGKVPLAEWLDTKLPLPLLPITFWGSPVTDFFPEPENCIDREIAWINIIKEIIRVAGENGAWGIVVKDLPEGHELEPFLHEIGFIQVEHEPIWFTSTPASLAEYLQKFSKSRRKGLLYRWRKFTKEVEVRAGHPADLDFIKASYENVWGRAPMRLEKLTAEFFGAFLARPECKTFIFERQGKAFAFVMLWQKDNVWFDKYMGTDQVIYREMSFYSMSILYLLQIAAKHGVDWYVAGQSGGEEKEVLGFSPLGTSLWLKPLKCPGLVSALAKCFVKAHRQRVYEVKERVVDRQ